jgi:oligopeptide transport system ATP-binding protein
MTAPLLQIKNLKISSPIHSLIKGVDFKVEKGSSTALVGTSGSGKSLTALSIIQLLNPTLRVEEGEIRFNGENLLTKKEKELQMIRGKQISMIFQDPMTSLNPTMPIGQQIVEGLNLSRKERQNKAIELLEKVGIADPVNRVNRYPHEFSGGMRQRLMIAMAIASRPKLLIADEPTSSLDVTTQAGILELLQKIKVEEDTTLLLITHDLGVVAGICDHVVVMSQGSVVESGRVDQLFACPQHPITQNLIANRKKAYAFN